MVDFRQAIPKAAMYVQTAASLLMNDTGDHDRVSKS